MNRAIVPVMVAALLGAAASVAHGQQAFKTPDEAASALAAAAKASDMKALVTVLGPDGEDIVSSGDEVADAETRQKFVAAYDAKHQIAMEGDDKAIVVIGQEDFPLPIPLLRKDGMWRFDTAAGRDEILFRRIGKNELDAIQACLAYVDAQNEYAEKDRTGASVELLRSTHHQPARKAGRALLAVIARGGGKPARRIRRSGNPARVSGRRRPDALSRLLLQDTDKAGARLPKAARSIMCSTAG